MTGPLIGSVDTRLLRVPLKRPWAVDVVDVGIIEVVVTAADGSVGKGFSWTPTIGAEAVEAFLRYDIAPFVIGMPAYPEVWQQVWERVHEAGGGGISTIALAGLDLALWDLVCRSRDSSLTDVLGRAHGSQPTYGSGVNLHYSERELGQQVQRWLSAGHRAVKIKVGKPELAEDIDRVAMVRDLIGPDVDLMVDANQRWDLGRAVTAAEGLSPFGLRWLEEPLRADDTQGHAALRRQTDIPVALGENAHTVHRFRDLLETGACDIVQPNVVRVGGITPFLRIVALAREYGAELAPHLLPELSGQLALALPETTWVEDVEDAGFEDLGALRRPTGMTISDGRISGVTRPGLGFDFA
ncbi:mandelate racemase/muconate lactonizing enzyme family protein [Arthrobacter sp. NPDC092385]|uniref:mandelate racemase/muconate lactonizing enzyme family protein n=1 Tax=Arthrobacter sp. NPDC092385 TaxID=3363943 RepID=UPI0037F6749C